MPSIAAYRVARRVARELTSELLLSPPFDIDAVAERYVDLDSGAIPHGLDLIVSHANVAADHPRVVIQSSHDSDPARRRFCIAHALGHVLLGWHPLGCACDITQEPLELPVTSHDVIEGEANAFARELLMPRAWLENFDMLDRPADLIRLAAERAGVPLMPAARAIGNLLDPHHVWVVLDEWSNVLDSGRSPGTNIQSLKNGEPFDGSDYARLSIERHRADLADATLLIWRFDPESALSELPRDRSSREVASAIGIDLGYSSEQTSELIAQVEGVAGWAYEQEGVASLDSMSRAIHSRFAETLGNADVLASEELGALVHAKATELVTKRLTR